MENKLNPNLREDSESSRDDPHPMLLREREIDMDLSNSKRIRISAQYMQQYGFYEGDIDEIPVFSDTKGKSIIHKSYDKIKNGKGIKIFLNGDAYNGDWVNNKMHGQGGYYFSAENKFFKGDFKENEISGRGVFFYSDTQDFYLGEVFGTKYHGKGLYYQNELESWELCEYKQGRIIKSLKTGKGKPQSLEISKEIVFDDPNFQEIYIKPKDFFFDHFEGDIVNGKYEGNGILFHKDGSRYEGSWKNNKPNGLGITVYTDQKFDIGEYKNGLLHGFARTQFHHGDIYQGYFYKGRMQGLGVYHYKESKKWIFSYLKNNNISKEFERGNLNSTKSTLPNFGSLEQKYKHYLDPLEEQQDRELIDTQIQASAERKRKSMYGEDFSIDNGEKRKSSSPNRKKMVNILIEEARIKKHPDNNSTYCQIF